MIIMGNYMLSDNDRATLQYKVTSKLREVILKGEFKKGERLVQEEWAERLGVSRMPIREALQQLEVEGLVKIEPRRGAIVTPISINDIEEIYFLRSMLEPEAVKRSIPNLTENHIAELTDLYHQMKDIQLNKGDIETYTKLNKEFHTILKAGCEWRRLHQMIDTLWRGISAYTPGLLKNHITVANEEHGLMLKYIKENKPEEMEAILRKHILRTRDQLIDAISTK